MYSDGGSNSGKGNGNYAKLGRALANRGDTVAQAIDRAELKATVKAQRTAGIKGRFAQDRQQGVLRTRVPGGPRQLGITNYNQYQPPGTRA